MRRDSGCHRVVTQKFARKIRKYLSTMQSGLTSEIGTHFKRWTLSDACRAAAAACLLAGLARHAYGRADAE